MKKLSRLQFYKSFTNPSDLEASNFTRTNSFYQLFLPIIEWDWEQSYFTKQIYKNKNMRACEQNNFSVQELNLTGSKNERR